MEIENTLPQTDEAQEAYLGIDAYLIDLNEESIKGLLLFLTDLSRSNVAGKVAQKLKAEPLLADEEFTSYVISYLNTKEPEDLEVIRGFLSKAVNFSNKPLEEMAVSFSGSKLSKEDEAKMIGHLERHFMGDLISSRTTRQGWEFVLKNVTFLGRRLGSLPLTVAYSEDTKLLTIVGSHYPNKKVLLDAFTPEEVFEAIEEESNWEHFSDRVRRIKGTTQNFADKIRKSRQRQL